MMRIATLWTCAALTLLLAGIGGAAEAQKSKAAGVLDFTVKDVDGKDVDLAKYRGDVLLVVNTASKCGYTPQYAGLESLYEKYKDKGFAVLAFPANDFGRQEPGTDPEIKAFCKANYHVTFPVFSKIVVNSKEGIHPLYQYLTGKETDPKFAGAIPWNFTKFLVDRKGQVIARFEPKDEPGSPEVTKAIESALAESK